MYSEDTALSNAYQVISNFYLLLLSDNQLFSRHIKTIKSITYSRCSYFSIFLLSFIYITPSFLAYNYSCLLRIRPHHHNKTLTFCSALSGSNSLQDFQGGTNHRSRFQLIWKASQGLNIDLGHCGIWVTLRNVFCLECRFLNIL